MSCQMKKNPASIACLRSHMTSRMENFNSINSAYTVNCVVTSSIFLLQQVAPSASSKMQPDVDFPSSLSPPKSESLYPMIDVVLFCSALHNLMPTWIVPARYHTTTIPAVQWPCPGLSIYRDSSYTAYEMSSIVVFARYRSDLINLQ